MLMTKFKEDCLHNFTQNLNSYMQHEFHPKINGVVVDD